MSDTPPSAVLAVDAGNSKTDVAVIGADGSVLGAARGGGFQPPIVGVQAAIDTLAVAVAAAAADAGLPASGVASHVSACLANADLPVEERQLAQAVQERGWGTTTDVRNDTFAILRAGLPSGDAPRGVAVVCGAGINCVGMLPDGRTARFPAIGQISGDWGGGSHLATEALWHAARAEDGRGGRTELVRALPAHFGLSTMYELIEALHLGRVEPRRRHELTPVLFEVAAAGDAVATSVVERLAEEVVVMAAVALGKLGLLDEPAPVLLGGGVLAARHPQLDAMITERLAVRAPKAVADVVTAPPVLGSGLLGLDHLGAPPEAHVRLAAQYADAAGRPRPDAAGS
ncbi:N-acetylglucosamine kinase [Streptomyces sp. NRRL F-5126]|uniref:N-acetylglucosamine kinase n=1 Tax=Streptomyces sp. NRRL F-5126 TaxID=1463857 RepID=UPI000D14521B|nr:BadF/BadG/BcrA/BcrD ATPase family protein [Streptomyces sp. NRRL F-5126]